MCVNAQRMVACEWLIGGPYSSGRVRCSCECPASRTLARALLKRGVRNNHSASNPRGDEDQSGDSPRQPHFRSVGARARWPFIVFSAQPRMVAISELGLALIALNTSSAVATLVR